MSIIFVYLVQQKCPRSAHKTSHMTFDHWVNLGQLGGEVCFSLAELINFNYWATSNFTGICFRHDCRRTLHCQYRLQEQGNIKKESLVTATVKSHPEMKVKYLVKLWDWLETCIYIWVVLQNCVPVLWHDENSVVMLWNKGLMFSK